MRQNLYLLIFAFTVLASCSKNNSDLIEVPKDPVYQISKMEFYQTEMDRVDSIFTRLDTMVHINNTETIQPDFTFEPYEDLLDSLTIIPDDSVMGDINIAEGIYLPTIFIHNQGNEINDVYYSSNQFTLASKAKVCS